MSEIIRKVEVMVRVETNKRSLRFMFEDLDRAQSTLSSVSASPSTDEMISLLFNGADEVTE